MVPFLLPTPAHGTALRFPRGKMSDGCETTDNCVVLSLALILVVKFLGGGGTSSGLLKALVLETASPAGGQVNTHTREQQEALVKATTHRKKFFVTGGEHINSKNMFISAEMGNREREITEMEKGKKVHIEFHARRDAALVVLDRLDHQLDGNAERLTNKDLVVLLRWKGVLPSKMGNMANKRALYQQFAGNRGDDDLGDPARWTEADEANLEERINAPIEMGDTAYG